MTGGYVIIDLKKINVLSANNNLTLNQLGKNYFNILKNTNKVILVENFVYENSLYKPCFASSVSLFIPQQSDSDKRLYYELEISGNVISGTSFTLKLYEDGTINVQEN